MKEIWNSLLSRIDTWALNRAVNKRRKDVEEKRMFLLQCSQEIDTIKLKMEFCKEQLGGLGYEVTDILKTLFGEK